MIGYHVPCHYGFLIHWHNYIQCALARKGSPEALVPWLGGRGGLSPPQGSRRFVQTHDLIFLFGLEKESDLVVFVTMLN